MRVGKKPTEPKPTGTDWQRVKREAAADAPVVYDPTADTAPYDPNDAAAVAAFWHSASIKRGPGRPAAGACRHPPAAAAHGGSASARMTTSGSGHRFAPFNGHPGNEP